jgi:hypothetical protein
MKKSIKVGLPQALSPGPTNLQIKSCPLMVNYFQLKILGDFVTSGSGGWGLGMNLDGEVIGTNLGSRAGFLNDGQNSYLVKRFKFEDGDGEENCRDVGVAGEGFGFSGPGPSKKLIGQNDVYGK